jgi:hypothetical protein
MARFYSRSGLASTMQDIEKTFERLQQRVRKLRHGRNRRPTPVRVERSGPCDHRDSKLHGFNRDGSQRFRCRDCGKTWQEPRITEYQKRRAGIAVELQIPGETVRSICRRLGVAEMTVRREMLKSGRAPCGCGRPGGHKGWCRFRYNRSEKRQQFIEQWSRSKPKEKRQ